MDDTTSSAADSRKFPTTAWTLIRAAQDSQQTDHVEALQQFAARYWKPVFYFVRAKGHPLHAAEDLIQAFFLRLLEKDWLRPADAQRGRFRTFLLTMLTRFLADQGPARAPGQMNFERQLVSIGSLMSDADRMFEPAHSETAETLFMRQWAAALVNTVTQRLRGFYDAEGRPEWFDAFQAMPPEQPGQAAPTQHDLADQLGMTRDQVRYALSMAEQRFAHFLREEVRDQVGSEEDVGEEINELLAILNPS